ncbi:MAG: S8 family peptidase [Pseudomonadota bacterium]
MADERNKYLPHILLRDTVTSDNYTRPNTGGGGSGIITPARNRTAHANFLISQIEQVQEQESDIINEQKAFGLDVGNGIYLSFESEENFELKFESLEYRRSGIELCSVKKVNEQFLATVFIPEGKLSYFLKKITLYRDENTVPSSPDKPSKPKNKELIDSISAIKLAALKELWTDDLELFPEHNNSIWWEVWLRHSDEINYEDFLREHSQQLGMRVSDESIHFLDRTIVLVYGNKEEITRSIKLLGSIAEVRRAKETAEFFTSMDRIEQSDWIENTLENLTPLPANTPSICLLDTGVNENHPLLNPVIKTENTYSYNPVWGTDDRYGHGTPMAGLALYGDLTILMAENSEINLTHSIESVKITPNPEHHTDKNLYGAITRESISRVEIDSKKQRVFCMAVTTNDDLDRGKPSSWSATIDAISSGYEDEQQRLIIISAGNTNSRERHNFPASNFADEVHDPGQSWNALTVGGYTEKVWLDTYQYPDWKPISPFGDLSPSSCTTMQWAKTWPIKPDIVMEAGNMGLNPYDGTADYIDDALQLLSTGHQFAIGKQLVSFGDTSASTALASRLAAMVQAQYPDYWPETIRALIVHSAQWTDAMKSHFNPLATQDKYRQLLRYCGYGVPNVDDLFWSTKSSLSLIAQDSIQPFFKDGTNIRTKDINVHTLPWPDEELRNLPDGIQVEMKVTLSYFIEPNPGERGWTNKYRYASHGLRFDAKRPLESLNAFKQRLNQQARDEEYNRSSVQDSGKWLLGENLRKLGSIHSDTWTGTPTDLSERGYIAVYPVLGWWKQNKNLQRWGKSARYALIITIKTPGVESNIYSSVQNLIAEKVLV